MIRAVLVLDDGVYLLRTDGRIEPYVGGGFPRLGQTHATTRKVTP